MKTATSLLAACLLAACAARSDAQEMDTVRVGSPALRGARLPLGTVTVESFAIEGSVRKPTSTTVRTITPGRDGADSVYVIRTLHWAPQADTSVTVLAVRADDLSLVYYRVKATRDSAAVTASPGHLTGWVVMPDQPVSLLDRTLDWPVFALGGQIPWLLPVLPLAQGYRAVVSRFSQWEGGEVLTPVEVQGSETVTLGSRSFDCWRVDTGALGPPGYRMIRWIDKASRRVVQSVLRGSSGGTEYWGYLRP